MNPIMAMAIQKATEKQAKAARGSIEPGVHNVDVTVRVHGTIKQGEEYTQRFVQTTCPWTLLKLAFDKLSPEEQKAIVTAGAKAALGGEKPDASEIKESAAREMERLGGAGTRLVAGKVKPNLAVEIVTLVPSNEG